MTGRSKIWLAAAVVFFFVNLAGGVMAAIMGERQHAGLHAVLLVLGAVYVRRVWRRKESANTDLSRELTEGLTHLQQSVSAIAMEVERIGEGQRYITRLFTERTSGESAAEPTAIKPRDEPPRRY